MRYFLLFRVKYVIASMLFMLLFAVQVTYAQKTTVTGQVTDQLGGAPLANVSVVVKGTTNGVTTGTDGNFSIAVPNKNAVLVFTYVGYNVKEITVGNNTNINVQMSSSTTQLNDVVVVGYGTQKKVTVTGAVAQVKGSELEKSPVVNLSNSLAGRLPGVTTIQSSGEPGYDGSAIQSEVQIPWVTALR